MVTCNVTDNNAVGWVYNSILVFSSTEGEPSSEPYLVDGVEFTVTLLTGLISISFDVSSSINGRILRCFDSATFIEVTLQEEIGDGE